jgi:disulfide bond formation protein DsbB
MTHSVVAALAGLGVAGQALFVALVLALVGSTNRMRLLLSRYALQGAFIVASLATGGSLFLSEVAGYVPCELCWYQRICMYSLSLLTLILIVHRNSRADRYLIPLPLVGVCVSTYHVLVENHAVAAPIAYLPDLSCTIKWINYFGFMTIPTLALTGFSLMAVLLGLAAMAPQEALSADH